MGKNSLLKSTSEKTDEELKTKTKKKKPAAKAKPIAKAAPKTKKTAKAKAAPKAKAAIKAKVKAKVKAKAPAKKMPAKKPVSPKQKKVSVKDLVQKKFVTWKPERMFTVSQDEEDLKKFSAPPFVSGTKEETQRIKALLLKKFDMAEIKVAAEKAVHEEAAADEAVVEPEVSVSYDPPDSGEPTVSDPMDNVMKYMVVAFVILVALIIGTSSLNQGKYFLRDTDGALEIWQGRFSPMGEKLLITFPGVQAPEILKDTYSKSEAYPFIFKYYVDKADALLEVPGMPDFDGISSYLNKAMVFAATDESKKILNGRMSNMELVILLYKAEVATSKATITDLEKAKGFLGEAAGLDLDDLQSDLVDQKFESIDESIKAIEAEEAETAAQTPLPAESTATE